MKNKCLLCGSEFEGSHVCSREYGDVHITDPNDKVWDKEIKDTIQFASDLEELFQKYLTRDSCLTDVIIKCKQGTIKIERVI